MKNLKNGFVFIPVIIIALLLIGGGLYIALNNQKPVQEVDSVAQNDLNNGLGNFEQAEGWKTYANQKTKFIISYPNAYHVYLDHNLINYDENKYERGNSKGVKIQIQQHSKENHGYNLSTNDGVNKFIDKLNTNRIKNDTIENSNTTSIVPFSLGIFKFKNEVFSGPGGSFNIYYAFATDDTYYTALVWGEQNDQETVNKILFTFKIFTDNANQTNAQNYSQKSNWKTYTNPKYSFSISYHPEWDIIVKENVTDALVSLNFTTEQTQGADRDEFLGLVGCFAGMINIDPLYLGDFRANEPIEIDGVATSIYYDQNRGLETLKFYIPLIKQDSNRCGIFFQSFGNLNEIKKDIINSLDFTNGFETFINGVEKQFQTNLPTKG